MLGAADSGDLQQAASNHVEGMDAGELAGHLQDSAGNLPAADRGNLAQTLLQALGKHGQPESDVAGAGIQTDAAKNGDLGSVSDLIQHAASNPAALKDAAIAYITQNPGIVSKFAPPFVQGLLGRLTGGG